MISIQHKTLESLEFPLVLEQVAAYCITTLGTKTIEHFHHAQLIVFKGQINRFKAAIRF